MKKKLPPPFALTLWAILLSASFYFLALSPVDVYAKKKTTSPAPKKDTRPLAQVGNKTITVEYFKQQKALVDQTFNSPTKKQLLKDLIRFQIGLQEARKKNLQNTFFVKNRMEQAMYQLFIENSLKDKVQKIKVGKSEMKSWYRKYPEIKVSHILIQTKVGLKKSDLEKAKKRAGDIYAKVKKSKRPFENLVQIYSDDSLTKNWGGNLGWMTYNTLANFGPKVQTAVYKLPKGKISKPIRSPLGFHILVVVKKRPYKYANKNQIRMALFENKRKKLFHGLFKDLKPKYKVKINQSLLGSIVN